MLRKLLKFLGLVSAPCEHCDGSGVAYRIPDPNTGKVLELPCPWCRDDE